ncbi:asparagine synthetase A [Streptomyces albidoflavus]
MTHHEETVAPMDLRAHLTSPTTRSALLVQQAVLNAVRATLNASGFVEIPAVLVGPVTDPGVRGAKQADVDYYGARYKIMTSAILYKQAALLGFDRIFCIAPNVRLEPSETATTGRHLVEFHQIDVEMADTDRAGAMDMAQKVVRAAAREVVQRLPEELASLNRDSAAFASLLDRAVPVITHAEAVDKLVAHGAHQDPAAEISWAGECLLTDKASGPLFVSDYPVGSRGFYDRESTTCPGVLRNFDLLAPEGFGELASGGEREHDYARIVSRMRETGENPEKYGWYLKLAREGIRPSAGFGIGLERLTRYLTGLDDITRVTAFPKLPGVVEK